mgnify:CR=1 FL=1
MTLFEVNQAAAIIRETAHPDVNMIFGAVIDPKMGDDIRITVIATGFERNALPRRMYYALDASEANACGPSRFPPRRFDSRLLQHPAERILKGSNIHGLDQVRIDSSVARPLAMLLEPMAGDRDNPHIARLIFAT